MQNLGIDQWCPFWFSITEVMEHLVWLPSLTDQHTPDGTTYNLNIVYTLPNPLTWCCHTWIFLHKCLLKRLCGICGIELSSSGLTACPGSRRLCLIPVLQTPPVTFQAHRQGGAHTPLFSVHDHFTESQMVISLITINSLSLLKGL